jgi:uncharacterized protein (DUF488 family)
MPPAESTRARRLVSSRRRGARPEHPVFTLGHSNRTLEELVSLLRAHALVALVDIRSIRRSRANPQFNEGTLLPALSRVGIRYEAIPELGGLRGKIHETSASPNAAWDNASFRNFADYAMTVPFRRGLRKLLRLAARDPTAIMCAEAVWWRCHRRIVTDYLLARGVPVVHLFTETHAESASVTPFAVVGKGGTVTYPASRSERSAIETGRPTP